MNPFPTQNTTFFRFNNPLVICDQGGMHKCIPYENSVNAPYAAYPGFVQGRAAVSHTKIPPGNNARGERG